MTLRQEVKPKFFHYLWVAHLYNDVTWSVKHSDYSLKFKKDVMGHLVHIVYGSTETIGDAYIVFCMWV